ncbi:MAG: elongation factor G [Candidatus Magnetoglobus multicellularis str. Araruama]|uniref:Elongation factor G n=1 Tax=Candidatus Magnetoglobus multicellularis str. Araruama TaxID=890399 RepID=A0A1V1P3T4_9BACT|nr:MAG: elongation factor G [Candidatus Magnetoglobus multicellularis str. Araruama]
MSETVDKIRNIAIVAHGGAGKTSLAEAMLYNAKLTNRLGRVEDGNTVMDYEPEEVNRQTSINAGFHQVPWKKHAINIVDTPGDQNFFNDTKSCLMATDSALFVVDAIDGVKVQTEQAWEFADDYNSPRMIVLNKLDRDNTNFQKAISDIGDSLEIRPLVVQLPMGTAANFKGIINLIDMKAYTYADGKATDGDIPDEFKDDAESAREEFIENVAEADDELVERYLEGETLSNDEIKQALRTGTVNRIFVPVLISSATQNIGVDKVLDFMMDCMPSPEDREPRKGKDVASDKEIECLPDPKAPFAAIVFKTMADPYAGRLTICRIISGTLGKDGTFYNAKKSSKERYSQLLRICGKEQIPISEAGPGAIIAFSKLKDTQTGDTLCDESRKILFEPAQPMPALIKYAIQPKAQGDEDKIVSSLNRLKEEDTALVIERNSETKEILLSGRGQLHIESVVEKIKRKFNVEVLLSLPKVPYRETIKKKERVQGKHKKQSGGHGQYGDCWIQIEPLERGKGFEFVNKIVGGVIPRQFIPAVEKGIAEASKTGVLAGFPCIDFRATVDDGSYHAVDSSEMAFKIAGSLAFKQGTEKANPILLEPIMKVTIITPDEYMGDIMGDLNGNRRGRVLGMDTKGKNQVINAHAPMAEMLTYAPDLNSMTGGRGTFLSEFSHYEEVPAQLAEKIIEKAKEEKDS